MYNVYMERECGCFTKSEYENGKSFDNQKDAYNYAHIVTELMNEDFCQKHLFSAYKTEDNNFVIGVSTNPNSGSCGTGSSNANADSSCASGSCGC